MFGPVAPVGGRCPVAHGVARAADGVAHALNAAVSGVGVRAVHQAAAAAGALGEQVGLAAGDGALV